MLANASKCYMIYDIYNKIIYIINPFIFPLRTFSLSGHIRTGFFIT
nr:MAG TPA: hypothetical protein [Caudoviricetes sp.]